ncbi:MAG: response regulator [Pirellulales bacterium]
MSRIIIAEDSATQAQAIQAMLQARGFQVEVYPDGAQALRAVEANPPDLLLTDLDMPNMDGLELVEAVRASRPQVPVVLMTAFGSEEIAMKALARGAASYVPKRTLNKDLIETVDGVLTVGQSDRDLRRLSQFLTRYEVDFTIENDPSLAPAVIAHVQRALASINFSDENELLRIGVALEQAIHNAMFHGNLELTSVEMSNAYQLEDGGKGYQELIDRRRNESPYCDRKVRIAVGLSDAEAVFAVQDEGAGFTPPVLAKGAETDAQGSNRGLRMMASLMDEVRFNPSGNQITLVKRKSQPGTI